MLVEGSPTQIQQLPNNGDLYQPAPPWQERALASRNNGAIAMLPRTRLMVLAALKIYAIEGLALDRYPAVVLATGCRIPKDSTPGHTDLAHSYHLSAIRWRF